MAEPALKSERVEGAMPSRPGRTRYEDDLYTWVQEQVALLRAGAVDALDLAHIAEELSDVGAEQYNKLESALELILLHMLKWDHQPHKRTRSWSLSIEEHRLRAAKQLRKNPSLTSRIDEAVEDGFRLGRIRAAREMRVEPKTLPTPCPYDWTAIMTRPFSLDSD